MSHDRCACIHLRREERRRSDLPMDPDHPNTRHFVQVIGDIWTDYVRTHSLEECQELNQRVSRNRAIRQRMFGRPRAVSSARDE